MMPVTARIVQTPTATAITVRSCRVSTVAPVGGKLLILALLAAGIPVAIAQLPDGLVRRVAELGTKLVEERSHYAYTQSVKFHEIHKGGLAGRYEEVRDITFTPEGGRHERFRSPPIIQLRRLRMTEEDFRDVREVNPFVLTLETLRFYKVRYKGLELIDGVECHTLQLRPRQILYGQRFFDGLVWVGTENGQVIRIAGKPVPQIHGIEESNLFPAFTTRYDPVDGEHWFPTRTEGDDILPFPSGHQRVRLLIEYTNYKRFTASSSVVFGETLGDGEGDRR